MLESPGAMSGRTGRDGLVSVFMTEGKHNFHAVRGIYTRTGQNKGHLRLNATLHLSIRKNFFLVFQTHCVQEVLPHVLVTISPTVL